MYGRLAIILALLVYAAAVGCSLWGGDVNPHTTTVAADVPHLVPIEGLKSFNGVAMHLGVGWGADSYCKAIDRAQADGANAVLLVISTFQENGESVMIYLDSRKTMADGDIAKVIGHAKQLNMRVILMPIVLVDEPTHDEWRGTIDPGKRVDKWFDSYRDMLRKYAELSRDNHVDVLVVGSELVSMQKHTQQWLDTIAMVRGIYSGYLTYSSNWDNYYNDDLKPIWEQLDFIGMNSYWTLGENHEVSVEQIVHNWQPIQAKILKFQAEVHKPLILLEAGWCSLANAAKDPWDYTQEQLPADTDLQRKLYEAFFQAWWNKPNMAGFCLWEWVTNPDPNDKGYSPEGKPAEETMKTWFAKGPWDVARP